MIEEPRLPELEHLERLIAGGTAAEMTLEESEPAHRLSRRERAHPIDEVVDVWQGQDPAGGEAR